MEINEDQPNEKSKGYFKKKVFANLISVKLKLSLLCIFSFPILF